jgi:hypothetical protein
VAAITSGLGKNTDNLLFSEVFFLRHKQCAEVLKQFSSKIVGQSCGYALFIPKLHFCLKQID